MNLILTVIEITAPVFLLAALGFAWVRLGFDYRLEFVTRMAMSLAVPCLVFTALMQTRIDPSDLQTLSVATLVAYGLATLAVAVALVLMRLEQRTYLAPLVFGNTGNIGLPLAFFAFGQPGLEYAVVVFAVMAVYSFTFGVWVVAGGGSPLKMLREPLVAATVLGGVFLWQGWQTPKFLTNSLELIGQMAIPLMLITLGVAVARLHPRGIGRAIGLSIVKVAICLPIGWTTVVYFGLEAVPAAILVLQITTPVAVTSYLLAAKYEADSEAVAALVVASTILSVGVLPATLAFLL